MGSLLLFLVTLLQGLLTDVCSCAAVFSACRTCQMAERSLKLFVEMLMVGLPPVVFTFSAAIVLAVSQMAARAFPLLRRWTPAQCGHLHSSGQRRVRARWQ